MKDLNSDEVKLDCGAANFTENFVPLKDGCHMLSSDPSCVNGTIAVSSLKVNSYKPFSGNWFHRELDPGNFRLKVRVHLWYRGRNTR